jgi:hypothetical protein
MTYTDPLTGKNATCWEHCPLSVDPKFGAQDFIFTEGPRNMTGLQMQLKTWIGAGAGLSSVELLSPGEQLNLVSRTHADIQAHMLHPPRTVTLAFVPEQLLLPLKILVNGQKG